MRQIAKEERLARRARDHFRPLVPGRRLAVLEEECQRLVRTFAGHKPEGLSVAATPGRLAVVFYHRDRGNLLLAQADMSGRFSAPTILDGEGALVQQWSPGTVPGITGKIEALAVAGKAGIVQRDETEQGELHLDFKLSAGGETLSLVYHGAGGRRGVDEVTWTELQPNEAYGRYGAGDEWVRCTWASPMRPNGARCGPPEPPPVPPDDVFADYTWPAPTTTTPLTLSELALSPAAFIEVRNTSGAALPLTGYQVRIAPHGPNQPWPGPTEGVGVALMGSLAAGERATVTVTATDVAGLALPLFEGVVSLFALDGTLVDRIDFMRWPVGNALARAETPAGTWRFVTANTPAAANTAPVLASRDVGTYVRHLFTPGDYAALARGGTLLDQQGIAVRTGHHCTQPLMDRFGVTGTTRASFACFNTVEEVDAMVTGIKKAVKMLR